MNQPNRIQQQTLVGAWFSKSIAEELQVLAKRNERSRGGELRLAVKHWLRIHQSTESFQEEAENDSHK